jgi:hypothetical protein
MVGMDVFIQARAPCARLSVKIKYGDPPLF